MEAKLIAVDGDTNTHGKGDLIPSQTSVYINDLYVIVEGDEALRDGKCNFFRSKAHCKPNAREGAITVFVEGKPVHAEDMTRRCGAFTVVIGQSNVFLGDVPPERNVVSIFDDPIPKALALGEPITPPYIYSEEPYEKIIIDGEQVNDD